MERIDFKDIVDNIFQAVLIADKNDLIIYANEYFCRIFTTNCKKIEGKKLSDFISGDKIEIKEEK